RHARHLGEALPGDPLIGVDPHLVVVLTGLGGLREPGGGRGALDGARLGLGGPPAGGAGLDGLLDIRPGGAAARARGRDPGAGAAAVGAGPSAALGSGPAGRRRAAPASMASWTSARTMRPPGPVPVTAARSMSLSRASLRARGERNRGCSRSSAAVGVFSVR